MTVQEAKLMFSRTGGEFSTSDTRDRRFTWREGYTVLCDVEDSFSDILLAEGLPRINDLLENTIDVRVKSVKPTKVSPIYWMVDVDYEGQTGPENVEDSPLNDPPSIRWSNQVSEEEIDEDKDGKPISTVNGEPIKGIKKSISDLVLDVRRNYQSVDLVATLQYLHSINSDTFAGFAPGIARLISFDATFVIAEEVSGGGFWEVSAKIVFRVPWRSTPAKAWSVRVKHEGFYEKIGSIIKKAVDDNKEPVSSPVMLKADGTRETDPEIGHWLEFDIYNPLPYNALGLLN